MVAQINCFIPITNENQVIESINNLKNEKTISKIYLLYFGDSKDFKVNNINGCEIIYSDSLNSSNTIRKIADLSDAQYSLVYTKYTTLDLGYFALERFLEIAKDSDASMLYADHYEIVEGEKKAAPVIDYQLGSLRDDFNFGSVLFYKSSALKCAVSRMKQDYKYAGLYDLRLKIAQKGSIVHINEYLYSEIEYDTRKSGEKLFDYVDPKNRGVQVEMELACTEHLKEIGGYLAPVFKHIAFEENNFEYEASVIIPVYNRIKTIRDAIKSVFMQEASFKYNLIIIDNHSTDGTSSAIDEFGDDPRLIHVIPNRMDLGIGGCWNTGVHHPKCGKFAIQLDSDDVYSGPDTLQKIVDAFYEQNCAMVVGTYKMTNFNMEMIAPGIIDHKEWTPENGRNNALRINGLGAPRAFYTPLLREINLPNTSYGEDYALGLRFSREYQIGRIYDVLYCCRRWEDNSDASLDVVKMNNNNLYKDRIRTWELQARIALNK